MAWHSSMLASEGGHEPEAQRDLEKALDLDRNSAVVLAQLGEIELRQGKCRRAADLLGRALALRPHDATAAYELARALYGEGDLRGARARLEGSGDLLTENYQALCLLGELDAKLGDWSKAEDPLQAAVILDSRRPEAYIELARVYLAEKKPGEAVQELDEAKRLAPDSTEVLELMARAQRH
jgi:predicted Zn-dependent protease